MIVLKQAHRLEKDSITYIFRPWNDGKTVGVARYSVDRRNFDITMSAEEARQLWCRLKKRGYEQW